MNINGTDYSTTVQGDKTWSVDVAGSDLAADSEFIVSATGIDDNGNAINATATSTHTVDVDNEAQAPILDVELGDGIHHEAESTSDTVHYSNADADSVDGTWSTASYDLGGTTNSADITFKNLKGQNSEEAKIELIDDNGDVVETIIIEGNNGDDSETHTVTSNNEFSSIKVSGVDNADHFVVESVSADVENADGNIINSEHTWWTNNETIDGTGGNDTINIGTGNNKTINAGDGDDVINTPVGGNKGTGHTIDGGAGNDTLVIDAPKDTGSERYDIIDNEDGTYTIQKVGYNDSTQWDLDHYEVTTSNIENIQFNDQTVSIGTTQNASSSEESFEYPITIDASVTDADSESITSITIDGIPEGCTLSNTASDTLSIINGSVTLTPDQVDGLKLTSPTELIQDPNDSVHVTVSATSTEENGGDTETLTATLIDGIVEGVEYTTTSGDHGFTDSNGNYSFHDGDTITFNVGGVVLGSVTSDEAMSGQTFLQDIADVDRTDLNDEHLENMATFLQSVDSDSSDNILITNEMSKSLENTNINLENASEEDVQNLVESVGATYVDEEEAMEHVQNMIEEYTDIDASEFDEHIDDSLISATLSTSATEGISYTTSSGIDGVTQSDGTFTYAEGDSITFKDTNGDIIATVDASDIGSDNVITYNELLSMNKTISESVVEEEVAEEVVAEEETTEEPESVEEEVTPESIAEEEAEPVAEEETEETIESEETISESVTEDAVINSTTTKESSTLNANLQEAAVQEVVESKETVQTIGKNAEETIEEIQEDSVKEDAQEMTEEPESVVEDSVEDLSGQEATEEVAETQETQEVEEIADVVQTLTQEDEDDSEEPEEVANEEVQDEAGEFELLLAEDNFNIDLNVVEEEASNPTLISNEEPSSESLAIADVLDVEDDNNILPESAESSTSSEEDSESQEASDWSLGDFKTESEMSVPTVDDSATVDDGVDLGVDISNDIVIDQS
jgi:hypothetical protein